MNWRAVPNNDLWLLIAQSIITRPPSSVSGTKVKSHLKVGPHMTSEEQWLTTGNDTADEKAKEALHLRTIPKFHTNLRWKPMVERRMVDDARLATACLHEISQRLLSWRKNSDQQEEDMREPQASQPEVDPSSCSLIPFPFPQLFPQTRWDQKWLQPVGAYFALLKWPTPNSPPSEISCLELMLDMMIQYQFTMRKSGGASTISWDKENSAFYLPTRKEAMTLPERLLTELSRIWLFTLEYLASKTSITPVPRTSSRSLRHFAYNNCVPSFAMRPVLLAGQRVHSVLAATIRPGSRTLNFRVSIPRSIPGDLPPSFPSDFMQTFL